MGRTERCPGENGYAEGHLTMAGSGSRRSGSRQEKRNREDCYGNNGEKIQRDPV